MIRDEYVTPRENFDKTNERQSVSWSVCYAISMRQLASSVRTERRRRRRGRRDPRITVPIVHGGSGGLSEFPSIGELLAYIWKGIKARPQFSSGGATLIRHRTHQPRGHLRRPAIQTFALR